MSGHPRRPRHKADDLRRRLSLDDKVALCWSFAQEITQEEELRSLLEKKPNPVAYDGFEPSGRMHIAQARAPGSQPRAPRSSGEPGVRAGRDEGAEREQARRVRSQLQVLVRNDAASHAADSAVRQRCYGRSARRASSADWLATRQTAAVRRVADWFAQLNNKMGGDLKKIRVVGEYMIEVWKAVGMDLSRVEFLWASDEINKRSSEYWTLVMDVAIKNSLGRVTRCSQIMGRSDTDDLSAAQIFYPCMQCADIFFLKVGSEAFGWE